MKLPANRLRLLALIVFGAAAVWAFLHHRQWDEAHLAAALGHFGFWAPAVFIALSATATVLLIPGALLTLTGGGLFGPFWGTIWNLTAATISASIAFLIARYVAADWVRSNAGPRLSRIIKGAEAEGWRFIAFTRLVPIFPFNPLNYALGLTRISFPTYVVTSAICMLPGSIAYTYLGYAGRQAASGDAGAIRYGMIGFGLFAALALLPPLVRRMRGTRTDDVPSSAQPSTEPTHQKTL
jgi:uncharacterized membrane protein YdjX (TVP38/TMEM64 family)